MNDVYDDFEEREERSLREVFDRAHLKRLWGYVRPHRWLFAASFAILLGLFAIGLTIPWLVRVVIDGPLREILAGSGGFDLLWPYAASLAVLVVLAFAGNLFELVCASLAGQRVVRDLRVSLYGHVLRLSSDYFERTKTGRLVTRVSSDCENLSELFTSGVVATLADLLKIGGFFVALYLVSPRMTLIVALLGPVLGIFTLLFHSKARNSYRDVRGRMSRLTGWFAEAIQGVRVTRLFGREALVFERYAGLSRDTRRSWIRTLVLFGIFFSFVDFGTGGAQAALLWRGGLDIGEGSMSYGEFFQYWIYFGYMLGPVRELGEKYNVIQSALASAERIFHILDEEPSVANPGEPARISTEPAEIRFEDVSFHYIEGTPVLRDVSLTIPAGSRAALVGPTGAGKSTIVQLLTRMRDPTTGRVLVGGQDLREIDQVAHRRRIGIVPQEVFLFAANICENVRLHDEAISEERVARALEAVQAREMLARAGGLEAELGERGATLSQGERQLLAFARALVTDPQILVLDEATANIDSETEQRIQLAMERLLRDRTSLIVAHRLSTIESADLILVVEGGRISERGTHAELLAAGGHYAALLAALAKGED